MKTSRERQPRPIGKGVVVVPTELSDFNFAEQTSRPEQAESPRRKVPLNPGPLPHGGPVPESEILNREEEG